MIDKQIKMRPYWHVDMKWITALLFIPVFSVTLFLANLYYITNKINAVNVASKLLQAMYAPGGNNTVQEVKEIRKMIQKSPDRSLKPFPGLDIKITEQDLDKYPVDEIKGRVFLEFAKNMYDFDSGETGTFSKFGLMAIFTLEGHQSIGKILLYGVLISLVFLVLLVYFSYGFGRLISVGVTCILVSFPSMLFLTILQKIPKNSLESSGAGEISMQQRIYSFVSTVGPTISQMLLINYITVTILGAVLLFVGIVGQMRYKNMLK